MVVRRIESLGGFLKRVVVDEDGFMVLRAVHPICGGSSSYVSGPLSKECEELDCDRCGEALLKIAVEEREEAVDGFEP